MAVVPKIQWTLQEDLPKDPLLPASDSANTTTTFLRGRSGALYLFIDESGDPNFTRGGSDRFFLTCVATRRPFLLGATLYEDRCDFRESGQINEEFHAVDDNPEIKSFVYRRIFEAQGQLDVYAIGLKKSDVPEALRKPETIYSEAFKLIVDEICKRELSQRVESVVIITDVPGTKGRQKSIDGPLKRYAKKRFQSVGIPYVLLHLPSNSEMYLQVADYCCWAVQRYQIKGCDWPMSRVSPCIRQIGEVSFSEKEKGDPR